ncbi:MAG: hypothetical protein R3Y63_14200 [Eubacteriales bacterium]
MEDQDEIFIQKMPDSNNKELNLIPSIFAFILLQFALFPLYIWWLMLMFFSEFAALEYQNHRIYEFYFVLVVSLAPLCTAEWFAQSYLRKRENLRVHPDVFQNLCLVWCGILLIFSYIVIIPNNFIENSLAKWSVNQKYETQTSITAENAPKIIGQQPFFTAYGEDGIVISLYSVKSVPYLEYEDEKENHVVVSFGIVNDRVTDYEYKVEFDEYTNRKVELDRIFLVKVENSPDILLYTNQYASFFLFREVGKDDFFFIENTYLQLDPEKEKSDGYRAVSSYVKTIDTNLRNAVPVNPLDPDTVTYAHIPYYFLTPTTTHSHFTLEFTLDNRPVIPYDKPFPYPIGDKASDIDGNNYLSTSAVIYGDEIEYVSAYQTCKHVFQQYDTDRFYFYLTDRVDDQVRVSNVVTVTRDQFERGSWW